LVGVVTAECNGGYWNNSSQSKDKCCFVNEFVVNPQFRGKKIGTNLTKITIDPVLGIWSLMPAVKEMYTTIHEDNGASKGAFINGGYTEVITYEDAKRNRNTTVLKSTRPQTVAKVVPEKPEEEERKMYKKEEYG